MARTVIEFVPARQRAKKRPPPKPKRRKKPPNPDARAKVADRTFEVVCCVAASEAILEKRVRIRVKRGGLEENTYKTGDGYCYIGLVSEGLHSGKWTEYSWGLVSTDFYSFVREIESKEQPHVIRRDKDGPSGT